MYKLNKQQGYTVQHHEIEPLFCNNLKWSIIYKNVESLCCTPETNIMLLIHYLAIKKEKEKIYVPLFSVQCDLQ